MNNEPYGWNSLRAVLIMFFAIFGGGGVICVIIGILYLLGVIK